MAHKLLAPALLAVVLCASLAAAAPPSILSVLSSLSQGPPVGIPGGEDGSRPGQPEIVYDGHPRAAAMVGWISIAAWIVV